MSEKEKARQMCEGMYYKLKGAYWSKKQRRKKAISLAAKMAEVAGLSHPGGGKECFYWIGVQVQISKFKF